MVSIKMPDIENASAEDVLAFLTSLKVEKHFTLKECEITNKNFYDWRAVDIVPPSLVKKEGEGYADIMLTYFEWVWLQIVKDLRLMGISYKTIKHLRDECWQELSVSELIALSKDDEVKKQLANSTKKLQKLNSKVEEFNARYSQFDLESAVNESSYKNYLIDFYISYCLFEEKELSLLVRHDGLFLALKDMAEVSSIDDSNADTNYYTKNFATYPHITIPLLRYVHSFFLKDKVFSYIPKLGFVNADEFEVLEMIRKGGLKELTVKLDQKSGKIKAYEFKKDGDISREDMLALTRTFFLQQYESVSFKWKNNKTVYFERTSKKQF